MNERLKKVTDEIEWLKAKISGYTARLRSLERKKTGLENAGIVALVRGIDIPPDKLEEFARSYAERQERCVIPDLPDAPGKPGQGAAKTDKEDQTVED